MMTKDEFMKWRWRPFTKGDWAKLNPGWFYWVCFAAGVAAYILAGFWLRAQEGANVLGPCLLYGGSSLFIALVVARVMGRLLEAFVRRCPICPQCRARLDGPVARLVAIATGHCGACGTELWEASPVVTRPELPSKSEFLSRRDLQWGRARRAQRVSLIALLMVVCVTLILGFWLRHGGNVVQLLWVTLGECYFGVIAIAVCSMPTGQTLRKAGLLCPGCGKSLAHGLAHAVSVAAGVCGYCGTAVYQPEDEETLPNVALPMKEEYLNRRHTFRRRHMILGVLLYAGFYGWMFPVCSLLDEKRPPHTPPDVRLVLVFLILAFGYCVAALGYWARRRKQMLQASQLTCLACGRPADGVLQVASGKCEHCGSRVYARE